MSQKPLLLKMLVIGALALVLPRRRVDWYSLRAAPREPAQDTTA